MPGVKPIVVPEPPAAAPVAPVIEMPAPEEPTPEMPAPEEPTREVPTPEEPVASPPPLDEPVPDARPLPILNAQPTADPRPIRALREEAAEVAAPQPAAVAPEPVVADAPEPALPTDADLVARVAMLEARVDEQDVALRRVLKLLVDWAEGEHMPAPHLHTSRD